MKDHGKLPAKFDKADWHHVGKANCPDCEGTLSKTAEAHHAYKVRAGRMFTASLSGDPLD